MIPLDHYLAFLGVSLLVICTPGQDTALTIRNTLLGGRSTGVAMALGVAAGQATWTLATSAGLAVILTMSAPVFLAIRLAGAAYLIYLGGRSLLRAAGRVDADDPRQERSAYRLSPAASLWQGLLSNLSNAKMVAFFVSLLPQFAASRPGFIGMSALGLNFALLTLAWLTGYAFAVERLRHLLRRASVGRAMNALFGAVLVGLGLRVSAEALGR